MARAGIIAMSLLMCLSTSAGAASLQEEFNAAQAAYEQKAFSSAAAGFERVLARLPQTDPKNRTLALVRSRLGSARLAVDDYAGAAEVLELALPALSGKEDRLDRQATLEELGRAREALLEYSAARTAYAALLAELESPEAPDQGSPETSRVTLISTRLALARVSMFDDPALARRQLDLALPEAEAVLGNKSDQLGEIYTLRGRTDLMAGNLSEGYAWFEKALVAAGGLGRKVSLSDLRIRGDLALAAQLRGLKAKAREYLAYTGAGRLGDRNPLRAAEMTLPACGEATGLKPEDAAVVEFAIDDDGQAKLVRPIYATRTGPVALEFARAVAGWSWTPEALADIPLFWRSSVRLELRCTKQVERADIASTFQPALESWLKHRNVSLENGKFSENATAAQLAVQMRSALAAEAKDGRDDLSILPMLLNLAANPVVAGEEARQIQARAEALVTANNAPVDVRVLVKMYGIRPDRTLGGRRWHAAVRDGLLRLWDELKQRNELESRGGAWVSTDLATAHERQRDYASAEQLYRQVVSLPETVLPSADPIRQLAVVRLASLKVAEKRFDEADGLLQSAGLNPEQCELVDVKPVALNAHMGSKDFPNEALSWRFEGWVKVSYDIDSEGRVVEPRTVIAYPPFVFGPATEKAISRFRYRPIYRAGQNIGCTGYEQGVNYKLQ